MGSTKARLLKHDFPVHGKEEENLMNDTPRFSGTLRGHFGPEGPERVL